MMKGAAWAVVLTMGVHIAPMQAGERLPDPTRPYSGVGHSRAAGQRAARSPRLSLQSIVVSAKRRFAVINGRVVREGDRIGGDTLTRIEPYEVILERGGKRRRLKLLAGEPVVERRGEK